MSATYVRVPVASAYTLLGLVFLIACAGCKSPSSSGPGDVSTLPSRAHDPLAPGASAAGCPGGQRLFTVNNQCTETVWLGIAAGSIACNTDADCPSKASKCQGANSAAGQQGTCTCSASTDCGSLGQCNPNNKFCFWNVPTQTPSQLQLDAGTSSTLCFQAPHSGKAVQWSGNLFARTGCDTNGQNCETGECGNAPNQPCPTGQGGSPPITLAEFTLSNQSDAGSGPDFYDISIINGINVPVEMKPLPGTFTAQSGDPYSCASPGAASQPGQLAACSWDVQPIVNGTDYTALLRHVSPVRFDKCAKRAKPNSLGFCACTNDSDCTSTSASLSCGLAMNASNSAKFAQVCGNPVGWWSANDICGADPSFGAPISCANTVKNSNKSTSTTTNLLLCNGVQGQSCYSNDAGPDCCGCATSPDASSNSPDASSNSPDASSNGWPKVLAPGFDCSNNNPSWVKYAQPWLVHLKKACPTAYVYPFDDATSTFTCNRASTSISVAYSITFCSQAGPASNGGIPAFDGGI